MAIILWRLLVFAADMTERSAQIVPVPVDSSCSG
jgi:hypothetical protein